MNSVDQSEPIGPTLESLRRAIKKYQFQVSALVISIPLVVTSFNSLKINLGATSGAVFAIILMALWVYRRQKALQTQVTEMSYNLSVGSKLYRRPVQNGKTEVYFIFQEGHRYYYLENQHSGEKRLVSKDRILNDFDLIG